MSEHPLTDPEIREIYEIEGYEMAFEITRMRKETGLTFSAEALEKHAAYIAAFVTTRVMKHWNETGEPPVRMKTVVVIDINGEENEHG